MDDPQTFRRKAGIQGFEVQVLWRFDLETLKLEEKHSLETPEITPWTTQRHVPQDGDFKTINIL
jgi:hypothetical protein